MVSILTTPSIMYLSCAWQNFWLAFLVLSACAVSKGAIQTKNCSPIVLLHISFRGSICSKSYTVYKSMHLLPACLLLCL